LDLFAHENFAHVTRRQAALVHLGISALVAATIVAVMLFLWYPNPWFAAAGGGTLMLLLVGVDVVLGPLLTYIVFDPAKKSLAYDLAVIVMLQVAALIYGVQVMASARPAFIVYLRGAFEIVAAQDVNMKDIGLAKLPEFQSVPLTGPRLAAARIPADPGLQLQVAMEAATGGADFTVYPRFYIPYATASREAAARGEPLSQPSARRAGNADVVGTLVESSGRPIDGLVFLPLRTRLKEIAIVLTKAEGSVVGVLDLSPR
jgi:hypothetical protein